MGGSSLDDSGEVILLRSHLNAPRWMTWRFWTCSGKCMHLCPILSPLYLCFGATCRLEEAQSFRMWLTPHAIHFEQMTYTCGCCCKETVTKNIPLDKIQDVMVQADCCGDCCQCSGGNQRPYQLHIQTAGLSGPAGAELSVYCLEDVSGFRQAVLNAKKALVGSSPAAAAAGAGKGGAESSAGENSALILRALERIEAAINAGVAALKK